MAATPKAGMRIIDGCAAPGGKSFAAAIAMKDAGHILSCDINEKKLQRVQEGTQRLGFKTIETRVMDASEPTSDLIKSADIVLADVPCSGLGVIRKKPEIRYKAERDIMPLPELQLQIIENLSGYVKPGGLLLYSTCTLLQRENEDIVRAFLEKHQDFAPEAFHLPGPVGEVQTGMTTLWPHIHETDGFFICRLRRHC
jgi:16S rRNA (cytosine967-C5)-methyltransferase